MKKLQRPSRALVFFVFLFLQNPLIVSALPRFVSGYESCLPMTELVMDMDWREDYGWRSGGI
jgi:hypothetical protein